MFLQEEVAKLAKTAIDYPPMQAGASLNLDSVKKKIKASMAGHGIRREDADWCQARAKLVRAEFIQTIGGHWRARGIEWNRMQAP